MNKAKWLKPKIDELNPQERAEIDEYLVQKVAVDIESNREQYELVLADDFLEEARKLKDNWGKMQGLSTGYKLVDDLTLGLVGGEVIVIAGATSMGKTAMAVNITARNVAMGNTVLFVTLEMTKAQLTSRMLFVSDSFEDNASLLVYQKCDEFNWQSVDGLIQNAVKEMGVKLVVIDHLHYFTRELDNVSEDLGRITKEFKKNAIRHDVPIILLSHTRKGSGKTIDDLRGSSFIAQDADIVLMVYREEEWPDKIAVCIVKNRNRGYDYKNDKVALDFDRTKITEPGEVFA